VPAQVYPILQAIVDIETEAHEMITDKDGYHIEVKGRHRAGGVVMPPARPLPPTSDLKAAYYRMGSVRKVSRHFRVADWRVAQALYEVGVLKQPLAMRQLAAAQNPHKCESCRFARADRCPYMAADIDGAEAVLVAMGAEYTAREYTYKYVHATRTIRLLTVRGCPRWAEGSVAG